MKRMMILYKALVCLIICFVGSVHAKQYDIDNIEMVHLTDETKYVCNPENILSFGTVAELDSLFYRLEATTGIETVVVVVDSLRGEDCYSFSLMLGNKYGVGSENRNNGLVIALSTSDRCTQILTGRGLEGYLPDAICRRIQVQQMNEHLKNGNYDEAMLRCAKTVVSYLDGSMKPEPVKSGSESREFWIMFFLIFTPIILMSIWTYYKQRRCPNCKKFKLEQKDTLLLVDDKKVRVTETFFLCKNCQHELSRKTMVRKRNDYHIGGYGGYGGRPGGFSGGPSRGSFGGGSFGGGGSSWKF